MKKMPFRIKCFLSHLLISLLIASVSLFLIFKIWYPAPLHIALGIGGLVVMMLAIDVILGPLLTLVLAKEGKKGLKMDFVVIGVVQLSALLYGLYSIDKGRPVVIAFDINRFELVQKYMIRGDENKKILKTYMDTQGVQIPVAVVRPAQNIDELAERLQAELDTSFSSTARPELYGVVQDYMGVIVSEMKPITTLSKFNDKAQVERVLSEYPQADGFSPIVASAKNLTVLIDSKNKQVLGVVELRPW